MAFTRRSEKTRAAILTAARGRFAADGFERATIRAIAADADIDPSMVMRYFGSKDGLFAAAVAVDLHIPDLVGVPRDRLGPAVVRHFFENWESDEVLIVLLRSAMTNDAAAERLRSIFLGQVAKVADDPARAALVSSHLLGVALCRYVLRLPPLVELDRDTLIAYIAPSVQRYLTEPLG